MAGSLDIVIVNWNSGHQLAECVASLRRARSQVPALRRIVVVDNGSTDASCGELEAAASDIEMIRNSENRGFSGACNQGARRGDSTYILFLNPDTRVDADALRVPVDYLERPDRASVGIAGIQLVDENEQIARSCVRFPSAARFVAASLGLDHLFPKRFPGHFMTDWSHDETREVDQVMGAFFLVRRALFERLGGFDERFFVYFEELDFSLRARQMGFTSVYLAGARAYHRGGGVSDQVKGIRLFYSLRSRILYAFKHFGRAGGVLVLIASACLEPVTRIIYLAMQRSLRGIGETLEGYGRLWRDLPWILMGGRRSQP